MSTCSAVREKIRISRRDLAALVEVIKEAEYVHPSQEAKRRIFRRYGILGTSKDRILTAIFYKVMRRLGIVDKIIIRATGLPNIYILDPWLRAALRLATYLLVLNDHPLSNSLLHELKYGVAKFLTEVTHPYVGTWYWDLVDRILMNFRYVPENEIEELELKYNLPAWFIERVRNLLGPEEAEELFKKYNKRPLISLRVNTLKATVEEVIRELRRMGKEPIVSKYVPTVVKVKGPFKFDECRLVREGKVISQEDASAAASIILDPKPGHVVVDMCAAPGGKTSHMAELMRNQGKIYAFDVDEFRINKMRNVLKRLGVRNVEIYHEDVLKAPKILGEEFADRVLLDAPCSSSGTLHKYPEVRWRLRLEKIREISEMQLKMLRVAIRLAKPGGRILYTVCSIFPEEGEELVKKILREFNGYIRLIPLDGPFDPGFLPGTMRAWPHRHNTVGFFYALFEKVRPLK
ncbi:MAG: Fmu (Sun) domain-containing protein [Thermoprotei archaeon]|nr:MAG: Fmu (Sun) domain-containing protein [Thermoprotei archaeon]RLE56812.1 MAG: Fmu (Sun) domain-containing protein [Thermoprotei archaeon]